MKLMKKIRAIFNFKGKRAEMELTSAEIRGNKVFLHPADDPDHTFCVSGKSIDILIDPAVALTEEDFTVLSNVKLDNLQSAMEINPQTAIESLIQPKPEDLFNNFTEKGQVDKTDEEQTSDVAEKTASPQENIPDEKANTKQITTATSKPSQKDAASDGHNKPATEDAAVQKSNVSYTQFMPKMRTVSMKLYQEEYDMLMEYLAENDYKKTEYLLACVKMAANKKGVQTAYQRFYAEHQKRRKADREAARRAAEEQLKEDNQDLIGA